MAIDRFTVSYIDRRDGCTFFTRRHIWSFKRCLECMYDLNETIYLSMKALKNNGR